MTAAAAKLAGRADPLEVFAARAEVRAYLWSQAEIPDLHEAVDRLQHDAVRDGLVAAIGQDRVQAMIGKAFAAVRQPCIAVEPLPAFSPFRSETTGEPAPMKLPHDTAVLQGKHAAASTVDALVYSLRRGAAALAEPDSRRRLAELSTKQVEGIIARLIAMRPDYPAITDNLLLNLVELLDD